MSDQSTLTITSLSLSQSFGFFTIVVSFAIFLRSILPRSSALHHFTPCFVLNSCIVFLCYPVYFLLSFILFSFCHGISRDCVLTPSFISFLLSTTVSTYLCSILTGFRFCLLFVLTIQSILLVLQSIFIFFDFTSHIVRSVNLFSSPTSIIYFSLCFQFLLFFSLTIFILFGFFPSSSFYHIFLFALIFLLLSFISSPSLFEVLARVLLFPPSFFQFSLHLSFLPFFPPPFTILSPLTSPSFRHL